MNAVKKLINSRIDFSKNETKEDKMAKKMRTPTLPLVELKLMIHMKPGVQLTAWAMSHMWFSYRIK